MKKNLKRLIAFFVCVMMILSVSVPVFATNYSSRSNSRNFKDVKEDHWAYDDIMWMFEKNIINGIGNGLFDPEGIVTRAQFAKMMVNTLDLEKYSPKDPSFLDVSKKDWEYPYVEGAKTYLTGFRSSNGDYFKPSQPAVREDMAVALVKALGYQNEAVDESILNNFADAGQISPNLRKFVALSVKYGLVQGYTKDGQTVFNPQGNLTRAEAATLLYRAFKNNEEKVTYDDDKVTYDDDIYIKPSVSVATQNNGLVVSWNKINSTKLAGYMVVISANDSTPAYPDNGFLYYITDKNQTSAVIDNSTSYNGTSDFGNYLEKGKNYYISVTALYDDRVVAGNAVRKTYPGANSSDDYIAPTASVTVENGKLVMQWNKIDSSHFIGYKVVISQNDSSPKYPDNGYLYSITDRNTTSAVIDNRSAYIGNSDFGQYLVKGQAYYFSVTAIYDDRNVAGNTIRYIYPGDGNEYLYPAPVVYTSVENDNLVVRWNKITSDKFKEYRVVISRNDSTPKYPDNGYLYSFTDRDRTYAVINNNDKYNNGDFGNYLTKGEYYYFTVTAVYNDNVIVAGNPVRFQYNGPVNPEQYVMPAMTAAEENGRLVLRWNKIDSLNLIGYRVVASKNDTSPSYPENGYLYSITDRSRNYAVIDNSTAYTNGDFSGYFVKGEKYYFAITAVYSDRSITGNTLQLQYNGQDSSVLFPAPVVTTAYENGKLIVKWNKNESPRLKEYRLVISKNKQSPVYPTDGYYNTAYSTSTTSAAVEASIPYTNGDFTALTYGTEYYISVTAVYDDNKYVAGNAVKVLYLVPANQ